MCYEIDGDILRFEAGPVTFRNGNTVTRPCHYENAFPFDEDPENAFFGCVARRWLSLRRYPGTEHSKEHY